MRFRFRLLFRGLINRHRFGMKVMESFICAAKVKIELHITTPHAYVMLTENVFVII